MVGQFSSSSWNAMKQICSQSSAIFSLIIKRFDCELGKRGDKAVLICDNASCHKIDYTKFKNITVEFIASNMTGNLQPEDMGYFATVKKRFRTFRRNWLVENTKPPTLRDTITEAARPLSALSSDLVRCFWKVGGLIDAEDSDEQRVSDVLKLRGENNLTEEILDENSESEESVEVSELQVVQDSINELEIKEAEIQPARLQQSQITSFFTKQ